MKKVIIIGATSGIGKGLAERFLREGNTVGITGRREDKLQEICSQNKNCFYSVSDVTKDTGYSPTTEQSCEQSGRYGYTYILFGNRGAKS